MTEDLPKIDYSADVFSLGCVFGYALTSGSHPFGDGIDSRVYNIKEGKIDWPKESVIGDQKLKQVIKTMISKEKGKRPTLTSVIRKLEQIREVNAQFL